MSFLLFHSIAEIFSIIIAGGIFMFAWNSRRLMDNSYLLFIGIAYLFVGGIDLFHTLAYKGMGVFQGYNANLPTQLWIAARYMQSISLLIAPLLIDRKLNVTLVLLCYALAATLLLGFVFLNIFPDCYIEGSGLTVFKKVSEYVISLILVISIVLLFKSRDKFDRGVLHLLVLSIAVTIASELAFTFYISVYGISNIIGHIFKITAFYLVYRALIETGLKKPYNLLFRELKQSETYLRDALSKVKMLSGMLPICSSCKKIRDDKGYWKQIESYISEHSEAEFSHGICPECARRLYPEYFKEEGKSD